MGNQTSSAEEIRHLRLALIEAETSLPLSFEEWKRRAAARARAVVRGNWIEAPRLMGVSKSTYYRWLRGYK